MEGIRKSLMDTKFNEWKLDKEKDIYIIQNILL